MKLCILAAFLSLAGCSSIAAPRPFGVAMASPERCAALDDSATLWGTTAVIAGGLAGSSGGLTTVPGESSGARTALAVGAVVSGAVAAGAAYAAHGKAADFVMEGCAR